MTFSRAGRRTKNLHALPSPVFQVGTEAFTGSNAVFTVSSFNAAIN